MLQPVIDLTMAIANEAARIWLSDPCHGVRPVASGRSSSAWAVSSTSGEWIVRVPVPDSGRALSYRSEARIGELLHDLGHPVATWSLVEVDDLLCSVAPLLKGRPVEYGEIFHPDFAAELGRLLFDLHRLDASGFGPLVDDDRALHGRSSSLRAGIVDRWHHASIWPFDESDLSSHVVTGIAPELVGAVEALAPSIIEASEGPVGVLHSDLHREHLLRDDAGTLGAVLDFGDAFRGSVAWDFALLHWYYGVDSARAVAAGYPEADGVQPMAAQLAVAVGLYKLAKSHGDPAVLERLRLVLDGLT
jgi:aminoglycoside phosphotransferase (APT) family kinase protein